MNSRKIIAWLLVISCSFTNIYAQRGKLPAQKASNGMLSRDGLEVAIFDLLQQSTN